MTYKISVLIRSHNESKWIKNCISSLLNQTIVPNEICVLDNKSNDGTIEIIKSLKKVKVFNYNKNYLPGKMLNYGISKTKGDYILIISAHCLPYDKFFLEKLINPLLNNKKICASYSRQIPFSFSDPSTIRDLMLLYGSEDKLSKCSNSSAHSFRGPLNHLFIGSEKPCLGLSIISDGIYFFNSVFK